MIDPRELRIGNLVTIENKKAWPEMVSLHVEVFKAEVEHDPIFPNSKGVVFVRDNVREEFCQMSEFISPIKLSTEWLVKFGFKKRGLVWEYKPDADGPPFCKINDDGFYGFYLADNELENFGQEIKYVHQLQNLFFALTGEEL